MGTLCPVRQLGTLMCFGGSNGSAGAAHRWLQNPESRDASDDACPLLRAPLALFRYRAPCRHFAGLGLLYAFFGANAPLGQRNAGSRTHKAETRLTTRARLGGVGGGSEGHPAYAYSWSRHARQA